MRNTLKNGWEITLGLTCLTALLLKEGVIWAFTRGKYKPQMTWFFQEASDLTATN